MSDKHVRVDGSPVTHVVSWSDPTRGYTRCGVDFDYWPRNNPRPYARHVATIISDDCDCMTCLVKGDRAIRFEAYQGVGVSVTNTNAIGKLKFLDEE